MKKDITVRKDIELLVDSFYQKVREDDLLGFIFEDIARVNWEKHLPVMYDFFENMLFYTGSYSGSPMELHAHVNRLFPLTEEHFARWIFLFTSAADELFSGPTTELVKQRAKSIAAVMRLKILDNPSSADRIF